MPDPDDHFIEGIFNYCDRWCERCPLTARCRLFAMEQESFPSEASRDIENEEFWRSLAGVFAQTKQMLEEKAEELGIDQDDFDSDEWEQREARLEEEVDNHPLVEAAHDYVDAVQNWFKTRDGIFDDKRDELIQQAYLELDGQDPEAEAMKLGDAVDVIRWYQFQIAVKLTRALRREADDVFDPEIEAYDRDGSAKVSLLGIDRSIAAWTVLRDGLPDEDDSILDILVQLERLRQGIERAVPGARAFVRPGFDTPDASTL